MGILSLRFQCSIIKEVIGWDSLPNVKRGKLFSVFRTLGQIIPCDTDNFEIVEEIKGMPVTKWLLESCRWCHYRKEWEIK